MAKTTATAAAPERKERGTSIESQCKQIVRELALNKKMNPQLLEWIEAVNKELPTSAPNVTPEQRLAKLNADIDALYQSIADAGRVRPNNEEETKLTDLLAARKRVEAKIAKAKKTDQK